MRIPMLPPVPSSRALALDYYYDTPYSSIRPRTSLLHLRTPSTSLFYGATQTREHTLSIVRLSTTGEAKGRNFDDRWIVFRQKHVLGNQLGVRGVTGEHPTETAYLGFEIARCDALGVDILQARDFRVGRAHSVESGMGAYRKRGTHLIGDMLGHELGQPIVSEYDIQEITTYIFKHEVYKSQFRVLPPTQPKLKRKNSQNL